MTEILSYNRRSRRQRLYNFLIKINLFDDQETLSLVDQLLATRIFVSLLTISFTIIIFSTAFSVQTRTVTISSPSEGIFQQLSTRYSSRFSCSCKQSSIRQDEFLSFNPQYHPICTSQFINQTFISSLSDMNVSDYWPLDYRIMIASHFQILAALCRTINQTILDAIEEFSTEYITTNQVLLPDAFDAQIAALVDQLKTTTVAQSKYTNDFLWFNIFRNGIYSGLRTNYYVQAKSDGSGYTYFAAYYKSLNYSCSCKQNDTCVHQAGFYNWTGRAGVNSATNFGDLTTDPSLLFNLPGIMVGCLPYNSLLKSTLECFYNQSCIDLIQIFINQLSFISPLSSSRFAQNTTVNDLLDQLFIESWNNKSSFTNYFRVCSPNSCTYSYDRRFNLLYIIVTIISLFGGLKIILVLSAPFIVKLIRRLQKVKAGQNQNNEITTVIQTDSNQSFKDRLVPWVRQSHQQIITFNMFPFSSNIKDGLYSTRLYILLLIIGVFILVFYASISIQTQSINVHQPSLNEYERLYAQHSSTLVCPCTHLSISHSSIMYVQPRYHQVCSSDFVKDDAWLLYNNGPFGTLFALDFRIVGIGLFTILQTLCQMSTKTVANELAVFNDTEFFSAQVLANDTFNIQTSILIRQLQEQIIFTFVGLFDIIRASMLLNQFMVAGNSNARLGQTLNYDNTSMRFVSRNDYDNSCSCGTRSSCKRSQGFYCTTRDCFGASARPNQTIPGLVVNCLPVESLRLSSLECFYNASCIQMLIEWHSFGVSNLTIDPRVTNVIPLDPMVNSRFSPNTTLSTISAQLFIEDWTNSTNFSSYYNQCAPDECTYTYETRFNTAYIISTLFGIVGGLAVALRILIPPAVKLLRRIYDRCCRMQLHDEREAVVKISFIRQIRHAFQTMNLYRKVQENQPSEESPTTEEMVLTQRQQIATRFYIILFVVAILIILLFTGFNSQTHSVTISSPTESTFELLQAHYSSTFSCPCSQIAIQYSNFLSVEPSAYHQVCSSDFINPNFFISLWGSESLSSYYWSIDVKILSSQFRLLSAFCSLAKTAIDRKVETFFSREFITVETLIRNSFEAQMDSITKSFIIETPANFRRTHKYINDMLHANQLHNVFSTNWDLVLFDPKSNYIMSTRPKWYEESNSSCSCDISSTCSKSLLVNYDVYTNLSGLVIGCLPIYGLRQSTLECLYDSSCLNELADFADNWDVPNPLDLSLVTRFVPISLVSFGTLIDELFIETWQNTSNYSNYFSICAPLTCRYTYIERNSVLYMLTTFLGLYGGLTVGLKFLIWNVLIIYWKGRQWFTSRQRRIQPGHEN